MLEDVCQQSVVWTAKKVSGALHNQRTPVGAYTGIHDCHMDGAVRKILVARLPRIGAVLDVMGADMMGEIDDRGLGIDRENDPLHAGHEPISVPKISQESDDRGGMRHENRLLRSRTAEPTIPQI